MILDVRIWPAAAVMLPVLRGGAASTPETCHAAWMAIAATALLPALTTQSAAFHLAEVPVKKMVIAAMQALAALMVPAVSALAVHVPMQVSVASPGPAVLVQVQSSKCAARAYPIRRVIPLLTAASPGMMKFSVWMAYAESPAIKFQQSQHSAVLRVGAAMAAVPSVSRNVKKYMVALVTQIPRVYRRVSARVEA